MTGMFFSSDKVSKMADYTKPVSWLTPLFMSIATCALLFLPAQAADAGQENQPAETISKRSAFLERCLTAKRLGIDVKSYRAYVDDLDKRVIEKKNTNGESKNLDTLSKKLEIEIEAALKKNERLARGTPPILFWKTYKKDLQHRILGSWYPPKCNPSKSMTVSFDLYPNGRVKNIAMEKSSGIDITDASAIRAVQNACPFQPFTSEKPFEKVEFHFDFSMKDKAKLTSR